MAKPLYLDPEQFDDVQKDILNNGFRRGRNCVVSGCAGSGKSCIALSIFIELCLRDRHPVIVTRQRALVNTYVDELRFNCGPEARDYIHDNHDCDRVEWYSQSRVVSTYAKGIQGGLLDQSATDLLVDEAQDFTREEIAHIVSYFGNLQSIHFFGDDHQQIYEHAFISGPRVSMDELEAVAGQIGSRRAYRRLLYNNYRLPRPVAAFVDYVDGPESNLFAQCFGEGSQKPHLLCYRSVEDAVRSVRSIVRVRQAGSDNYCAAVVSYHCGTCEWAFRELSQEPGCRAARIRGALRPGVSNYRDPDGPKTLEHAGFSCANVISTTAFSSKGLQFDDVFVLVDDFTAGTAVWDKGLLNVLHVALTRTQGGLYVCYAGKKGAQPFDHVPSNLCNTRLAA